jgi:antitoxin PrlF
MVTATVTSRGRITLPVSVRNALGVKAGDRVEFVDMGDGQYAIVASKDVQQLKGMIRKPTVAVTIEQMNEAIEDCWATAGMGGLLPPEKK